MLIVFTGDGKGKTTAALGQAMRAIGNGSCVLMVQLIKGPWICGEDKSAKILSPFLRIDKMGKGFVRSPNDDLPFEDHVSAARDALAHSLEAISDKEWDILILDEIWTALGLGLVTKEEVRSYISTALPLCDHLIMTGRGCPDEFIERADLVTEMREIKHPYKTGIPAAKGVEF